MGGLDRRRSVALSSKCDDLREHAAVSWETKLNWVVPLNVISTLECMLVPNVIFFRSALGPEMKAFSLERCVIRDPFREFAS